jgi:hypothetical protein
LFFTEAAKAVDTLACRFLLIRGNLAHPNGWGKRCLIEEQPLGWRLSSKTPNERRQGGLKNRERLNVLTARFRNALKKSVEGIIEAGRVLIEAKNELEHGQFIDWVVRELRFGTRKDGSREADLRKAEMLMFLARNEVISKSCHWHDFPPSPRSLCEPTQIRPKTATASS